jgi:hypothetical protein
MPDIVLICFKRSIFFLTKFIISKYLISEIKFHYTELLCLWNEAHALPKNTAV